MTGVSFHDHNKVEKNMGASDVGTDRTQNKKATKRKLYIFIAIAVGILVTAGIVFGGIYIGHAITQAAYKEAKLQYTNEEGETAYETVKVKENEIDFESENQFSTIFDYEKMLVVVKTNDGTNDVCYVTRLVPDEMGTFDELKEQVIEANNSGVALTSPANEVIFFKTNIEADVSMLGETAAKMCEDTPILWLEKQQSNQDLRLRRESKPPRCRIIIVIVGKDYIFVCEIIIEG